MTLQELFRAGAARLVAADIPDGKLDARLLLEHVCGVSRSDILAHGDRECGEEKTQEYLELIGRRCERIPLQQLTGQQDFMGLSFLVNENVLIPRQDTEILVEEILRDLHGGSRILDMCTGSGCILISLLRYSNFCEGVGVDISGKALEVARANAARLVPEEKVTFLESDLFEGVTGRFDILVSNPPYIPSAVVDTLMPEVSEHEPRLALDGCEDGLFFYRKIIENAPEHLYGGAGVFFEIGYDQGESVAALLRDAGFTQVRVVKDYAGLDRVVCGVWKGMKENV